MAETMSVSRQHAKIIYNFDTRKSITHAKTREKLINYKINTNLSPLRSLSSLPSLLLLTCYFSPFFSIFTDRFELIVLGRNGVTVDGALYQPESGAVPLKSKALLQIGDVSFYFLLPKKLSKLFTTPKPAVVTHATADNVGTAPNNAVVPGGDPTLEAAAGAGAGAAPAIAAATAAPPTGAMPTQQQMIRIIQEAAARQQQQQVLAAQQQQQQQVLSPAQQMFQLQQMQQLQQGANLSPQQIQMQQMQMQLLLQQQQQFINQQQQPPK
jgi:hypothetical protein